MANRYELKVGKSNKFWEIKTTRRKTIVRYGRIGSDGRVVEKTYNTAAEAKSAAEKLIREKTRKGYQPVSKKSSKTPPKDKSSTKRANGSTDRTSTFPQPKPGEVVDVTGLIEAGTAGGVSDGSMWTLVTGFQAWKFTKGAMIEGSIRIEEPNLSRRRYNNQVAKFKPYAIRRVRLKLVKPRGWKQVIGELVKDFGPVTDTELTRLAKERKKPVSFKDPKLGKFVFDRRYSTYEGKPKWLNKTISLSFDVASPEQYEQGLRQAQMIWSKQKSLDQKVRKFACDELLENANDWLQQEDENAKPIAAATFKKRIALASVTVDHDGEFVFWLDDDDLFWGHVICVHANKDGKLTSATIAG